MSDLRPKLPSLCDDCVEVAQREQDALELSFLGAHFKSVLVEVVKRLVQICLHSGRRLVGDLDRGFQDAL